MKLRSQRRAVLHARGRKPHSTVISGSGAAQTPGKRGNNRPKSPQKILHFLGVSDILRLSLSFIFSLCLKEPTAYMEYMCTAGQRYGSSLILAQLCVRMNTLFLAVGLQWGSRRAVLKGKLLPNSLDRNFISYTFIES